ncbi:MAG: TIM-barrel domain-containing protein [Planctomycetota bacterium]
MSNRSDPQRTPRRLHGFEQVGALGHSGPLGNGIHSVRVETATLQSGARLEALVVDARLDRDEGSEAVDDPRLVLAEGLPTPEQTRDEPPARDGFAWDGHTFLARVRTPEGTHHYGTGERAGPLERTGRHAVCWNTDAFLYGDETPALYQSQPAVLAVYPDGHATLVLAATSRRTSIAIARDGIEFAVEGAPCVLLRIEAEHPAHAISGLTELIGKPARVPLWALGYHQCRWSYESAEELRALVAEFDARDLPLSAVWLDIDHMDRHRVFTWNGQRFPDPYSLMEELRERDLRTVAILDPGLAIDPEYEVWREAEEGEHLVRDPKGRPVEGRVWPGRCHFPDFTREQTRAWWSERVARFVRESHVSGLWCDMNEPAVFSTPSQTLPLDARHEGLGGGDHARFHNLYGQLMAEATRDGLLEARPDKLPFVLSRAAHLATPRTAATWTGDNQSTWEDLRWSVAMVLSLGLLGQPMSGPDIGGFVGDPGPDLFARWFEMGCYLPFFRGHASKDSPRKEPWAYGAATEARIRLSLRWRMRLLPYLQACFERAAHDGLPVVRPLFLADPADTRLRKIDDAYMIGEDLLVVPALEPGTPTRELPIPRTGPWRRVPVVELANDDDNPSEMRERALAGPDFLDTLEVDIPTGPAPCFMRVGSVIPLGPAANRPPTNGWPSLEMLTAPE